MSLLLSQQKYVIDFLSKHNMLDSKLVSTPLVIGTSLTATDGYALVNATIYVQSGGWWSPASPDDSPIYFLCRE